MALWLHSRRYANGMIRAGRLLVVFRGEYAELPDWAVRERDWMVARVPGIAAAEAPAAVYGIEKPTPPPLMAPSAAESDPKAADDAPARGDEADTAPKPRSGARRVR